MTFGGGRTGAGEERTVDRREGNEGEDAIVIGDGVGDEGN